MHWIACLALLHPAPLAAQDLAGRIAASIDGARAEYEALAGEIWSLAELGYQEHRSSALLQERLKDAGFEVEAGVAGIPTAFIASYGEGEPVIAILAEFDALPGLSQAAVPERRPVADGHAGHACGHHLFGTASTAAAIAVREWLEQSGRSGTVRLYGTPAEEGGGGKIYMVRAGLFDDVAAVLHWHPGSANDASPSTSLANISAKFRFSGVAAHAASAPHRGRSALDGVEAMNHMVNLMREHVPQETRIHYAITRGGEAPNVVPGTAGHSWQAVAAGGTSIGTKGMMVAAKTLALTAMDLFSSSSRITAAWRELEERRGAGFVYRSLVGDRSPPLDYRK